MSGILPNIPARVRNSSGTIIDPTTESTLSALILAINELNVRLRELTSSQAFLDTSGRTRVNVETGALINITTLGSIGSPSGTTATNAQFSAAQFNWQMADIAIATALRSNIIIT